MGYNRAEARAAAAEVGKGLGGQGGGSYWNASKQGEGRYVLRIMPPHPTRNPECLVFRPLHFVDKDIFACLRYAPDDIKEKWGEECCCCDVTEYAGELNENNPIDYALQFPDERVRDLINSMRPKLNTHAYALVIQEGTTVFNPPKPVTFTASAKTVTKVLDEEGLGRGADWVAHLTDPIQGKNFVFVKKAKDKYDGCFWEPVSTPMVPIHCSKVLWDEMMGAKYPNLVRESYDKYVSYEEMEKKLKGYGLVE